MRKCLAPFFIGREEPGLEKGTSTFEIVLPPTLVGCEAGSRDAIGRINCAIRDFVAETIASGEKPLVVCGDCLSAIGCLTGLERCGIRPYLLWFDAHGDFHTPETTISGHLGGMPLAIITGRGELSLLTAVGMTPLPDEQVCLVGGRDLEPGEKEALEASRICRCERITDVWDWLPHKFHLWVHFDTDYINPTDAPAMRCPASGGVSAQIARLDLDALSSCTNISGLSVSAWAPHLDVDARTAIVSWDAISSLAAI
jgi:arginase